MQRFGADWFTARFGAAFVAIYSALRSSHPIAGDVCFGAAAKLVSTADVRVQSRSIALLIPEPFPPRLSFPL